MAAWTPAERRGALVVVLLLSLGAARDLWRATHPRLTSEPSAAGSAAPAPAGSHASALPQQAKPAPGPGAAVVDLNRAGLAELDGLPGIGPVLAGRILQHRNAHGPFREPEDLLAVPGIGPRLFERLRSRVRAGPVADRVAPGRAAGR